MENSRRTAHLDLGQSASLEPGPSLIYTFYYYCPTHFPRLASLQFQFSAIFRIFRSLPDLKVAQSPKLWRLGAFLSPISHRKSFQFNYQTPRHFFPLLFRDLEKELPRFGSDLGLQFTRVPMHFLA